MDDPKHKHTIQKCIFDFELESKEKALNYHRQVKNIFTRKLEKIIDQILNEYKIPGYTTSFDRIELDLGNIKSEHLEQVLLTEIPKALRRYLESIYFVNNIHSFKKKVVQHQKNRDFNQPYEALRPPFSIVKPVKGYEPFSFGDSEALQLSGMPSSDTELNIQPTEVANIPAFIKFLETGNLPSSSNIESQGMSSWLNQTIENFPEKLRPALQMVIAQPHVQLRILRQLPPEDIERVEELCKVKLPSITALIPTYSSKKTTEKLSDSKAPIAPETISPDKAKETQPSDKPDDKTSASSSETSTPDQPPEVKELSPSKESKPEKSVIPKSKDVPEKEDKESPEKESPKQPPEEELSKSTPGEKTPPASKEDQTRISGRDDKETPPSEKLPKEPREQIPSEETFLPKSPDDDVEAVDKSAPEKTPVKKDKEERKTSSTPTPEEALPSNADDSEENLLPQEPTEDQPLDQSKEQPSEKSSKILPPEESLEDQTKDSSGEEESASAPSPEKESSESRKPESPERADKVGDDKEKEDRVREENPTIEEQEKTSESSPVKPSPAEEGIFPEFPETTEGKHLDKQTEKNIPPTEEEEKEDAPQEQELSRNKMLKLLVNYINTGATPVFFRREFSPQEYLELVRKLIRQFSPESIANVLFPHFQKKEFIKDDYYTTLQFIQEEFERVQKDTKKKSIESVINQIREVIKAKPKRPEGYLTGKMQFSLGEGEEIYIKNGGLVLVWPFLSHYFKTLGMLTADRQFKDAETSFKAIHMLEYIATKHTITPEYLLTLNKILCGVPVTEPIPMEVDIGQEAKDLAESMLKAIINQWPSMDKSSPDGLRGGFFIRDARLQSNGDNWLLRVDTKPFDLLLDRIKWGIGMVKLPWMPNLLTVEWR